MRPALARRRTTQFGRGPASPQPDSPRWEARRRIIGRIRALVRKEPPRKDQFDINDTILEVIALNARRIASERPLAADPARGRLTPVQGDRIQLQQVILNLILNAVEAMSGPGQ